MKILKKFLIDSKIKTCQNNYKKLLPLILNKIGKKKVRVLFLIRENQKWVYQSLYEILEKDSNFEPLIVVSLLTIVHCGKDSTRNNLDDNYKFFKEKNMNVQYAYKNNKYIDLKKFNADIVFYDEPWDLPKIHKPEYVSRFALTCYSSYSYPLLHYKEEYFIDFYNSLFRYFIEDDTMQDWYESLNKRKIDNYVKTGFIKFDEYLNVKDSKSFDWKEKQKIKVIYAPHHSFEKRSLNLATFRENGRFILELAKKYPQTTWVFKPHPRFKHRLLKNKIMSESEVANYYEEWGKYGIIHQSGSYFGMFWESDLLITDSSSFLAEYLPTKKPVIRLVNKKQVKFNKTGKEIIKSYYNTENNYEIEKIFREIVINKNDVKKEDRKLISEKLFNINEPVCNKIFKTIRKDLRLTE